MPSWQELQKKNREKILSTNSTKMQVAVQRIGIIYIRKKYSENNTLIQSIRIILPFLNCQTIPNCVTRLLILVEKVESIFLPKNPWNPFPAYVSACGKEFPLCGRINLSRKEG
jgi:hypothetical protein